MMRPCEGDGDRLTWAAGVGKWEFAGLAMGNSTRNGLGLCTDIRVEMLLILCSTWREDFGSTDIVGWISPDSESQ